MQSRRGNACLVGEGDVGIVEPRINLKINYAFRCLSNIEVEAAALLLAFQCLPSKIMRHIQLAHGPEHLQTNF
jgi:hypothetical protein